MSTVKRSTFAVRCPHCLDGHTINKSTPLHTEMTCKKCRRVFAIQDARPAAKKDAPPIVVKSNEDMLDSFARNELLLWIVGIPVAVLAIYTGAKLHVSLNRFSFLIFMAILFLATWGGSFLLRYMWLDFTIIRLVFSSIFVGICVHRLMWAAENGSSNVGILIAGTIVGGIVLWIRESWSTSGFSGGSRSSTGGCSGCASDGGCGGCGGD